MEEILQDLSEFPFYILGEKLIMSLIFLCLAYIVRPRGSIKTWWKTLAVFFVILWVCATSIVMGKPFVGKENFESLVKLEDTLQYNDNEGFYLIPLNQVNHFELTVRLLDDLSNLSKYEEQPVTIWQKNHVAYQLEYNGNVIYSLERSNSKVWLGIIADLMNVYFYTFCGFLFFYFVIVRTFEG